MNVGNAIFLLALGKNRHVVSHQLDSLACGMRAILPIGERLVSAWPVEPYHYAFPTFRLEILRQLALPLHNDIETVVISMNENQHVASNADRVLVWIAVCKSLDYLYPNCRDPHGSSCNARCSTGSISRHCSKLYGAN